MNVSVSVSADDTVPIDSAAIASFATSVLEGEGLDDDSSVAISFVAPAAIADLNQEHMGKQGPTDVLSFPIEDAVPGQPPRRSPGGPPVHLGDIFIATDVVRTHAAEYQVSFESELHLMIVHGILHLLGWDHMTDEEATAMEAREGQYLATVGLERR